MRWSQTYAAEGGFATSVAAVDEVDELQVVERHALGAVGGHIANHDAFNHRVRRRWQLGRFLGLRPLHSIHQILPLLFLPFRHNLIFYLLNNLLNY